MSEMIHRELAIHLELDDKALPPIPRDIAQIILPDPCDTIKALTAFPLLRALHVDTPLVVFNCLEAEVLTVELLADVPIPSPQTIKSLRELRGQAVAEGARSFAVIGGRMRLPLWLLQYWQDLVTKCQPNQGRWRAALKWLNQRQQSESARWVGVFLCGFPWSGSVAVDLPLLDREHSPEACSHWQLSRFLSRQWLSTDCMNLLLSLVYRKHRGMEMIFLNQTHIRQIIQTHEKYSQSRIGTSGHSLLRAWMLQVGQWMSESKDLNLAGFYHENYHWISFATLRSSNKIAYGDPVQQREPHLQPSVKLIGALEWFLRLFPVKGEPSVWKVKTMESGVQDLSKDTYSCSMLSFKVLSEEMKAQADMAYVKTFAASDKRTRDECRIEVLYQILTAQAKKEVMGVESSEGVDTQHHTEVTVEMAQGLFESLTLHEFGPRFAQELAEADDWLSRAKAEAAGAQMAVDRLIQEGIGPLQAWERAALERLQRAKAHR
ncbi:hypothetical protein FB451DRAFT_1409928 [Mycena latifolia]|nr:hypothetical protein FB451DRAFT_1409928 [Mycena latifolia]